MPMIYLEDLARYVHWASLGLVKPQADPMVSASA